MTTVTVFRHVPAALIGVLGVGRDREFEEFEQILDWLDTTGILVERYDPEKDPGQVASFPGVDDLLARKGLRSLPIILVDGVLASSATRPTRGQLARIVGRARREHGTEVLWTGRPSDPPEETSGRH